MNQVQSGLALGELLQGVTSVGQGAQLWVKDLALDSRQVRPGSLFLAVPGSRQDGAHFIEDALRQGAVAVLVEQGGQLPAAGQQVPVIAVPDLASRASAIAARFFAFPSQALWIAGITGTNGKTSCAWWLQQLLGYCGVPSASLGTLGLVRGEEIRDLPGGLTTADAVGVQRELAYLRDQGLEAVAMEVSSHGLEQGRVNAVEFDLAVFTNLTQDHLDYHGDLVNYAAAKRRLFEMPGLNQALVNLDDAMGRQLAGSLPPGITVQTYSREGRDADYRVLESIPAAGLAARVQTPQGEIEIANARLFGRYNLANLLAVLGAACIKGLPLDPVVQAIGRLTPAPGRLECVSGADDDIRVFVDFAHTPDGIAKTLSALRERCSGALWCVLGAGGDRDRSKRPLMAQAAAEWAGQLILTSDNPRSESPLHIIEDMRAGLPAETQARLVADRAEAIVAAVVGAAPGDCVAILGKGHERYQQIGDQRLPFSDALVARQALLARRGRST